MLGGWSAVVLGGWVVVVLGGRCLGITFPSCSSVFPLSTAAGRGGSSRSDTPSFFEIADTGVPSLDVLKRSPPLVISLHLTYDFIRRVLDFLR